MGDIYMLMRALCESKRLTRAGKWRPPSETQLDLEKSLTRAIKTFISSARLTRSGVTMPDETAHEKLLDTITNCLERAIHEGKYVATGRHERGIISATKNIAGRTVQLIGDIADTLRDKARAIIAAVFGDDSIDDPEQVAEQQLGEWATDYAGGVAENEIQTAVQETIVDEMADQGVKRLDIVLNPDACNVCGEIVEKSPTVSIEDGERLPPYHFGCKCGAIESEK